MLRRRSAGVSRPPDGGTTTEDRRSASTSKLRDIFKHGASNLDEALDDFEIATKLTQKNAVVQRRGADRFYQWARDGGNAAIDDIAGRIRDLMHLHADQQTILAEEVASYVHVRPAYSNIACGLCLMYGIKDGSGKSENIA
ncbi:hypothetical protein Aduo_019268 [Ancylostoma duodenale]